MAQRSFKSVVRLCILKIVDTVFCLVILVYSRSLGLNTRLLYLRDR